MTNQRRWIAGRELMQFMDLTAQELYDFTKLGLSFYDNYGRLILRKRPTAPNTVRSLGGVYEPDFAFSDHCLKKLPYMKFKIDEVRGFLKERDLMHLIPKPAAAEPTQTPEPAKAPPPQEDKPFSIPVPDGTTWGQINVRIVNDQRIEITHPGGMAPWTMKDMGLDSKPQLKNLFELFAVSKGNIRVPGISEKRDNVRRLKELIKSLFPNVKGEPIKNYQTKHGYACAFYIAMADTSTDDEKAWENQSEWRKREAELKDVMGAKIVYDPREDLDKDKDR